MKKSILPALFLLFAAAAMGENFSFPQQLEKTCAQSIEVYEGTYGKEYSVNSTEMASLDGTYATATTTFKNGSTQIELRIFAKGNSKEFVIPAFDFRRILLTETSVWFLSADKIREFNLSESRLMGEYPSFQKPFEMQLTSRARGFTYSGGYLYIAHGELGVAVFDTRNHQHYTVIKTGLQPGSLAAAVQVQGSDLYLLQGAYHPQGFNGVAIVNLNYGTAKLVSYPESSGVVDPYSSSMKVTEKYLLINNSGWIHGYLLSNLKKGPTKQAPSWIRVSETIESAAGKFDKFLMIQGDFVFSQGELLACSSVSYVPVGQRRPIKEWRFIRKKI